MKKEYTRISWDDYPEAVTDMETGANGKRRKDNYFDMDERIITIDTSKIQNE